MNKGLKHVSDYRLSVAKSECFVCFLSFFQQFSYSDFSDESWGSKLEIFGTGWSAKFHLYVIRKSLTML